MKDHFALLASVRTKAFGHRNHVEPEHVNVLLGLLVIARMIGTHMIDHFGRLSKTRFVATIQFALESHVTMTRFQVSFGVRDISIAKVTSKFAFDGPVMPLGLEMILSAITTFIPSKNWKLQFRKKLVKWKLKSSKAKQILCKLTNFFPEISRMLKIFTDLIPQFPDF